ncbi:hypothetical protein ASD80_12010 [Devosia sp. Root635]|nr:hypothetical protein ASD80_12010 [Devosia sp. Root635]
MVYNIVEGHLTGSIDGTFIDARAGSGGRAGSKTPGAVNTTLANNPFGTGVKLSSATPGGALPLGFYSLRTHESRQNWIRLVPAPGTNMHGRAGMAIHGRGKRGSDGCIVPADFNVVLQLHKLCKAREKAGQANPTLEVLAIGDLDQFTNRA